MIGNDVVDLALARKESNWRRSGYLQKIFTVNEQLLIESSSHPELLVWNLWSRKEAAYKIYNRETGIRAFIPKELECIYTSEQEGVVYCRGNCYPTKTFIEKDFLHSIAVNDIENFKLIVPVSEKEIIIKKEGLPFVHCTLLQKLHPISISHHGRYYRAIALS